MKSYTKLIEENKAWLEETFKKIDKNNCIQESYVV